MVRSGGVKRGAHACADASDNCDGFGHLATQLECKREEASGSVHQRLLRREPAVAPEDINAMDKRLYNRRPEVMASWGGAVNGALGPIRHPTLVSYR